LWQSLWTSVSMSTVVVNVGGCYSATPCTQLHHVRSLCLSQSRANRIRQSYKAAGQLRRSRSQCTSKLLLKMHTVASSTDDAAAVSSNNSNNSSTGLNQLSCLLAAAAACWRSIPVVTTAIRLIFDGRSTVCQRSLRSQWRNRIAAYSFISARQHAVNCLAIPSFCAVVLYLNIYLVTASP